MLGSDSIIRVVAFSALILTNVLGNSVVVGVILKTPSLWSPINFLLVNLAFADLMVGVAMAPVFVLDSTFTHPLGWGGDILCKLITSGNFTWVGGVSSTASLVLISIERYFAVMKPTSFKYKITTKRLKAFIPISWAVAVIFNLPQFLVDRFDASKGYCTQNWPSAWAFQFYSFLWVFLAGAIPSCLMVTLHTRVAYFLWFAGPHQNPTGLPRARRLRKQVTKMMLIVTAIFFLCWNTDVLMYNLASFGLIGYRSRAQIAGVALALINSAVNPIVYAFQFRAFRAELVKRLSGRQSMSHATSARNSVHDVARLDFDAARLDAESPRLDAESTRLDADVPRLDADAARLDVDADRPDTESTA